MKIGNCLSRRAFLQSAALVGGSAVAWGSGLRAAAQPFFARHQLPIGLQLYTLGESLQNELDTTLAAVAKIGYRSVEMAGFLGRTATELRAAFDRAGLTCRSAHVSPQSHGDDAINLSGDLDRLASDARIIGIEYIVAPIFNIPQHVQAPEVNESGLDFLIRAGASLTADDWSANARFLNEKGRLLQRAGLKLGYHNHNFEFAPLGRTNGLNILLNETDPALVSFEMDVGWVAAAGADPIAILHAHPGRFQMMHVKDIKASVPANFTLQQESTEVGSGIIGWTPILAAAYKAGIKRFYVEQEPPFPGPRLNSARKSYEYLSQIDA